MSVLVWSESRETKQMMAQGSRNHTAQENTAWPNYEGLDKSQPRKLGQNLNYEYKHTGMAVTEDLNGNIILKKYIYSIQYIKKFCILRITRYMENKKSFYFF